MLMQTMEAMLGSYTWIFALAVAFGLALVLTLFVKGKEISFLSFLLIFIAFMVWGDLLDGWVLILMLIIYITLIIIIYKRKGGIGAES